MHSEPSKTDDASKSYKDNAFGYIKAFDIITTRQSILSVIGILLILSSRVIASSPEWESPTLKGIAPVVPMLWIFLIFVFVILSLINWRCPRCRKYLGRSFRPRHCKHCGVKLRID